MPAVAAALACRAAANLGLACVPGFPQCPAIGRNGAQA